MNVRQVISHRFLILVSLACSIFSPSTSLYAQTSGPAPLPPSAQEALNKGIIAAKVPDYLLAIRFFEDARKLAPEAPIIYLNLGLAESRIPSRELRAMAWFGAYLAAYPDAPNAAAVKSEIEVLDVRNRSTIARLIKSAQDIAFQVQREGQDSRGVRLGDAATLWAETSDIAAALTAANLIGDDQTRYRIQSAVAVAQAETGDIAGAINTATLVDDPMQRTHAQVGIAEAQIKRGDIAGARNTLVSAKETATRIDPGHNLKQHVQLKIAVAQANMGDILGADGTVAAAKNRERPDVNRNAERYAQEAILDAQLRAGDFEGALGRAELIDIHLLRFCAYTVIAAVQAKRGDIARAQTTIALISQEYFRNGAQAYIAAIQAGTKVPAERPTCRQTGRQITPTARHWLASLESTSGRCDLNDYSGHCPLNTPPFLDLALHLRSLPQSDDPHQVFHGLRGTAAQLIKAHNVVAELLKEQFKEAKQPTPAT